eukprot:jgi/Mesen1/10841/ME000093S10356
MAQLSSSSLRTLVGVSVAALFCVGARRAALAYFASWTLSGFPLRARVVGIIPAQFHSKRFEGKPLTQIMGKPMIQRTWEQAMKAKTLHAVVVATDDERIADCCRGFGARVVMTSSNCANGTERCAQALKRMGGAGERYGCVVNIQGDEPLVDPAAIDALVLALQATRGGAVGSTAVARLDAAHAADPNRVKCVRPRALLLAHAHPRQQCYDAKFLLKYVELPATALQGEEDLEQLKVIEHGYKIKVINVEHCAHGVDSPDDVKSIEAIMKERRLT